jgi:hypothetical protein
MPPALVWAHVWAEAPKGASAREAGGASVVTWDGWE